MSKQPVSKLLLTAHQHLDAGKRSLAASHFRTASSQLRLAAQAATEAMAGADLSQSRTARAVHAACMSQLAYALGRCWKLREALATADAAVLSQLLRVTEQHGDDAEVAVAQALNTRGEILTRLEQFGQAHESHERAVAVLTAQNKGPAEIEPTGAARLELARALIGRGNALADGGHADEAEPDYLRALELASLDGAEGDVVAARAATCLGNVRLELGDLAGARAQFSDASKRLGKLVASAPGRIQPMLAHAKRCQAQAELLDGELDASIGLGLEASVIFERLLDPGKAVAGEGAYYLPDLVMAKVILGRALTRAGRLDEAQETLQQASRRLLAAPRTMLIPPGIRAQCDVDLGNALADSGALRDALPCYDRAINTYGRLVNRGEQHHIAALARTRTNRGNAMLALDGAREHRLGLDDLVKAERHWNAYLSETSTTALRPRVALMHTRNCLAKGYHRVGSSSQALGVCEETIRQCATIPEAQRTLYLGLQQAKAHTIACRVLAASGRIDEALQQGEDGLSILEGQLRPESPPHVRAEYARCSIDVGNLLSERREFQVAVRHYLEAIAILQSLVVEHPQYVPALARAETSLGNAYRRRGDVASAIAQHRSAATRLRALLPSQAHQRGRLGHALRCLADSFAQAKRAWRAELTYGAALKVLSEQAGAKQPMTARSDMALAHSRRGRLLKSHGDVVCAAEGHGNARDLYERAAADFTAAHELHVALAATSVRHRVEEAHVRINLALVHSDLVPPAERTITPALRSLRCIANECIDAAENGHTAMAGVAIRALREKLKLWWLHALVDGPAPAMGNHRPWHVALLRRVEELADLYLDRHHGQLQALESYVDLLTEVRPPVDRMNGNEAAMRWPDYDELVLLCMRWVRTLVSAGDPRWLCDPTTTLRIDTAVRRLQRLSAHRHLLVAEWFIHCVAVRSDRSRLRASTDPRALELLALLDERDSRQREALGQAERTWNSTDGRGADLDFQWPGADDAPRRRDAQQRIRQLLQELGPEFNASLRHAEIDRQLLEIEVGENVNEALILLCLGPGESEEWELSCLWIVVLQPSGNQAPRVVLERCELGGALGTPRGLPQEDADWERLFPRLTGNCANRLRHWVQSDLADADRISLIPSPRLCSMPWHLLLDDCRPERLYVFPSVAAWTISRRNGVQGNATDPGVRQVETRCADAWCDSDVDRGPRWLAFAQCEGGLGRALWGPRAQGASPAGQGHVCISSQTPATPEQPADTLVTIGHAEHIDGTGWNSAGLQRVFVSACLVARNREFLCTSLGVFATLFDHEHPLRTAIGAVRRVRDLDAALISLAFQFAASAHQRATDAGGLPPPDWRCVFAEVQRRGHRGQWPIGFGPWLVANLGPAIARAAEASEAHRTRWFKLLSGPSGVNGWRQGVFGPLDFRMTAGEREDWTADLNRLAALLAEGVPKSVRRSLLYYIVLGR